MPKQPRPLSHHRYSNPLQVPATLPSASEMSYYTSRSQMDNYYEVPSSSPQNAIASSAFDPYASLALPPGVEPLDAPVRGTAAPPQHRASSGAWTVQDDQTLLAARASGHNWSQIQANYFPTKTGNACRKRHERLMERRGVDDWDARKLERLSREYMAMRKEIWQPLAQRCGEKWNVVEQKCMSSGLKNIQAHARAYSRRARLETGLTISGYDDDSGVSGIELTPVDDAYSSSDSATSGAGPVSSNGPASSNEGGAGAVPNPTYLAPMHSSQGGYQAYHYGHPTGAQHGYNSSVSSTGTAPYTAAQGHPGQPDAPYIDQGNRLDMGIGAIINRGSAGGGTRGV